MHSFFSVWHLPHVGLDSSQRTLHNQPHVLNGFSTVTATFDCLHWLHALGILFFPVEARFSTSAMLVSIVIYTADRNFLPAAVHFVLHEAKSSMRLTVAEEALLLRNSSASSISAQRAGCFHEAQYHQDSSHSSTRMSSD